MFNIGFAELILILLVAFLVVGPKELPRVARSIGKAVRYLRQKWKEFIDENELADTINELKSVEKDLKQTVREADPTKDLKKMEAEINSEINGKAQQAKAAAAGQSAAEEKP